jgi:hypothetical protein
MDQFWAIFHPDSRGREGMFRLDAGNPSTGGVLGRSPRTSAARSVPRLDGTDRLGCRRLRPSGRQRRHGRSDDGHVLPLPRPDPLARQVLANRLILRTWAGKFFNERESLVVGRPSRGGAARTAAGASPRGPLSRHHRSFNRLWMVCGRRLFSERGHGSIWPAASDPGLLRHDRPHQPDPAGLAPASSSRSTGRRADARSLRSARESPFRSREAPDCRQQKDPRPKRGVARSCSRPNDRSEVSPPGSRGSVRRLDQRRHLTLCVLEQPNRRPRLLQLHDHPCRLSA